MKPRTGAILTMVAVGLVVTGARGWAASDDLRLIEAAQGRDTAAVQSLIADDVDVNIQRGDGATALAWAAHWNDLEMADLLLAEGADPNLANDLGWHRSCSRRPTAVSRWPSGCWRRTAIRTPHGPTARPR